VDQREHVAALDLLGLEAQAEPGLVLRRRKAFALVEGQGQQRMSFGRLGVGAKVAAQQINRPARIANVQPAPGERQQPQVGIDFHQKKTTVQRPESRPLSGSRAQRKSVP